MENGWKETLLIYFPEETAMQCDPWVFMGERWNPQQAKARDGGIRTVRDLDVFNLGYSLAMHLMNNWHNFL